MPRKDWKKVQKKSEKEEDASDESSGVVGNRWRVVLELFKNFKNTSIKIWNAKNITKYILKNFFQKLLPIYCKSFLHISQQET